METRGINKEYEAIAEDLIRTEQALAYIKNSNVRIAYLQSDQLKKNGQDRVVHGECEKVQAKNQWAINYDFTITLFYNNNLGMTPEQIRVLLFHELLHVGIEKQPDGTESYSIVKHDLEDFKYIVDRYGVNWNERGGLKQDQEN